MNDYGVSRMKVDIADVQVSETTTRLCAAVYKDGEEVVRSEWFEVDRSPPDERSELEDPVYEDALADAASQAEGLLAAKLMDEHNLTDTQAHEAIEMHLDVSEMPTVR
jgi:hypothetical protein